MKDSKLPDVVGIFYLKDSGIFSRWKPGIFLDKDSGIFSIPVNLVMDFDGKDSNEMRFTIVTRKRFHDKRFQHFLADPEPRSVVARSKFVRNTGI